MIHVVEGGTIYKNPKSYLVARQAWHPSIVCLPNGELLASFDIGQAVESLDYATWTSRSRDGGESWSAPERLSCDGWLDGFSTPQGRVPCTHSIRIGLLPNGHLVGVGARWHRHDTNEGLTNRKNLGFVPMDLFLIRSRHAGWTWTPPEPITPGIEGPAFELCHRLVVLSDGRWLIPTSTWRGWDGSCPNGMQAIALVSRDQGATWTSTLSISNESNRQIINWEVGVAELPGGALVATVWRFDERQSKSIDSRFCYSSDAKSFGPLLENNLSAETAKVTALRDGRILCLYRRTDRPGLWAELASVNERSWTKLAEVPLWQGQRSGMFGSGTPSDELGGLKFGYPSAVALPDGDVIAVFWCREDCHHVIRWVRLQIN